MENSTSTKIRRRGDRFIDPEDSFRQLPQHLAGFASAPLYNTIKNLISADINEIIKLLQEETATNIIYHNNWITATSLFQGGRSNILSKTANLLKLHHITGMYAISQLQALQSNILSRITKLPKLPDECHIAIIAYSMEARGEVSLYADFNKKCRGLISEASWNSFPYKSFYALLARAIHGVFNIPSVNVKEYYRGIRNKVNNLKVGDYVYPTQFLSTSVCWDVAKEHLGSEGTLITFKDSPVAGIGIVNHSDYPEEQEILVYPWNCFKVVEIQRGEKIDNLTLQSYVVLLKDLPYSGLYAEKGCKVKN